MKSAEKFYREIHAAAAMALLKLQEGTPLTASDVRQLANAVEATKGYANFVADHDKQAKARRERIQWARFAGGGGAFATRVGHTSFRWDGTGKQSLFAIPLVGGEVLIGKATGVDNASRMIRAWRKKQ